MTQFFDRHPASHYRTTGEQSVAVITRTKDRPLLLSRALESVLNQTHTDWHLFLVNDGGDRTQVDEIVQRYTTAFKDRLTVIHHETSKGMEAASNAGLAQSKQAYFSIHDDDDSWQPEFLERAVGFLNSKPGHFYSAVATNCHVIKEDIRDGGVIELAREPWEFFSENADLGDMIFTNRYPPISLVFRSSLIEQVGTYNELLPVLGDWDFNLRVLSVSDIATIDEQLANYHHRVSRSAESDVYGNTVTEGNKRHAHFSTLYTNHLVRQLIQQDSSHIGLIRALQNHTQSRAQQLHKHLDNMWDHFDDRHEASATSDEIKDVHKHLDTMWDHFNGLHQSRAASEELQEIDRVWLLCHLVGRRPALNKPPLHPAKSDLSDLQMPSLARMLQKLHRKLNIKVHPTFDETAYLSGNEDVRDAVEKGAFASGYIHYLCFGLLEGRDRASKR
ncbi:MAG: glycosyltransferase family 2 protein [Pseudomonadota bacterium]